MYSPYIFALIFAYISTIYFLPICKIIMFKFCGLHIEIVIPVQSIITNNTDYIAGIYFVIIMCFKLL